MSEREVERPDEEQGPLDVAEENEKLLDRLMRLQAEFENYRKRIAREKSAWTARAMEGLVLDLLPVQDAFDRALETEGGSADPEALLEGMKLVHRLLVGALSAHGVEAFDAVGEPFDPNLHEAFLSRPAAEGEVAGTIVEEVVKGYRMGDRTIRATRGIVASSDIGDADVPPAPEEE